MLIIQISTVDKNSESANCTESLNLFPLNICYCLLLEGMSSADVSSRIVSCQSFLASAEDLKFRIILHQSFRMNKVIIRNTPGSATCARASPKEDTGLIPAVVLANIHPVKLKYTVNLGFLAKAHLIISLAVLKDT